MEETKAAARGSSEGSRERVSGAVLEKLIVTFHREDIEVSVSYAHRDEPPTPGSKTRTRRAARMAEAGLRRALEGLDRGSVAWGWFSTSTQVSTDRLLFTHELTGSTEPSERGAGGVQA